MIGKFNNEGTIVPLSGDVDYQTVLNALMPVGYVYVQYPQSDSPEVLWPGFTWQQQNYNGAFFRSSGAGAHGYATCTDNMAECLQDYQNAYHRHIICDHKHSATTNSTGGGCLWNHMSGFGSMSAMNGNGCFEAIDSGDAYGSGDYTYTFCRRVHLKDHSHTVTGGSMCESANTSYDGNSVNTEARPKNYTIRIWKRVA